MKISYNWLKEFVDINLDPYILADKLTLSGLEVESLLDLSKACFDAVVGEVISKKTLSANLFLVTVNIKDTKCSIVTSDAKLSIGNKVGVVCAGSEFNGKNVEVKKFGEQTSEGFLLSASEIGLEASSSNVLVLDESYEVGNKLATIDDFRDFIFEISITPNRADCLSVLGIAREVSIYYKLPVKMKEFIAIESDDKFSVSLLDKDCPSYIASNLKVNIKPSCFDIRFKLVKSGVRPINNVVDITNYCMLALGQPMHAFDRHKIGNGIIVRNSTEKEHIVALNDNEYELSGDLIISDDKGALAIAGIMGGKFSQIGDDSKDIILESAYFVPDRIRSTSKRLKLSSESSYRFERGVDPNLNEYATYYAIDLLKRYADAEILGITKNIRKKEPVKVIFSVEKVNDFLGTNYESEDFYDLGLQIKQNNSNIEATIPTYRFDIESMEDISEEIARISGYDKLKSTIPCVSLGLSGKKDKKDLMRQILISVGSYEAINYSFVSSTMLTKLGLNRDILYIKNPLIQEQDCMRNTLFSGLMDNLMFNVNHNIKSISMFEIGKIFDIESESEALGIIMYGYKPLNWYTQKSVYDFYDIKGAFESIFGFFDCDIEFKKSLHLNLVHPNKSLSVYCNDKYIGFLGEIHPDVLNLYDINTSKAKVLYGELLIDVFTKPKSFSFRRLPKFPIVVRDLNIVVTKVELANEIQNTICSFDFVYKANLIDVYDMQDNKSLNFRIALYSQEKTLTDDMSEKFIDDIFESLKKRFGAQMRG